MRIRSSKDTLGEFFQSAIWEDVALLVSDRLQADMNTLKDPSSSNEEMRVAQGAVDMGNYILNLPKMVEDEYDRMREESDDE